MALQATIYKAEIHIADNDRAYYASHAVTLARHPSETAERLMVRLLAYALHAGGDTELAFTRGLSDTEAPDLWRHDLTGNILQWVEVGLPEDRRLLKACGRSDEVLVYAYGRNAGHWWNTIKDKVARARNLRVMTLPQESTQALAELAQRNMTLHVNIQESTAWVTSDGGSAAVEILMLRGEA